MGKYPVVVAILLALAGCGDSPSSGGEPPVFRTAGGDSLDWASLRGEWVLVNYWAEWCKPCLEEIPELNRVDELEGVTVLAVNYDGVSGEELVTLGERMGIEYTMLAEDPAQELDWSRPDGLPATFIVDREGGLRKTLKGAQTEADLMALIGRD